MRARPRHDHGALLGCIAREALALAPQQQHHLLLRERAEGQG